MKYYENSNLDGTVVQIHIADIHFGAIDPLQTYNILREQFLLPISTIHFDILSIDGDLFDKRFLASSDAVMYAIQFVMDCVELCVRNSATLVILAGTLSHDAGQLSLFYNLKDREDLDIRIVETLGFEYIKGLKILCVPEEYGKGSEYYINALCQPYDACFAHCTVVGSVYGANKFILDTPKAPVFDYQAFSSCRGPVICGHVHKAMCFDGNIYYVSNPIRYRFGEEEEKGYMIVIQNPNGFYTQFMPIESFRYSTIKYSDIQKTLTGYEGDIVAWLDNQKAQGIDHIRVDFDIQDGNMQEILERHYASDPTTVIKRFVDRSQDTKINTTEAVSQKYAGMDFLLDNSTDGFTKFVNFVNYNEGKTFITVDQLKAILSGKRVGEVF